MWKNILKAKGVQMSYRTFAKYGFLVTPWVILSSNIILCIEMAIYYGS
jgi:Na+/H+ antiporter NhaD/arsenite permease-like protein